MLRFIFCLLISIPVFACTGVNVEGKLAVDGQTWKMNMNIAMGKDISVPMGPYIFTMKLIHPEGGYLVKYRLEEKKGTTLTLVTKGEEEEIELNKSRDIMARGEEGQPNSIITLRLKDI